jgi:hypothetical protein
MKKFFAFYNKIKINLLLSCFLNILISGSVLAEAPQGAWIDIPTRSFVVKEEAFAHIGILIDKYHSIDKKSIKSIDTRIDLLKRILQQARIINDKNSATKVSNISKLIPIAEKKIWYLEEIKKIYTNKKTFEIFTNLSKKEKKYTPIFLVNDIFFDFKLPTYWGLFWLEVLDPCHRMLTAHYIKWQESGSSAPFFLWLEDQEFSFRSLQVKFFSSKEIENSELKVSNGLFINAVDGKLADY